MFDLNAVFMLSISTKFNNEIIVIVPLMNLLVHEYPRTHENENNIHNFFNQYSPHRNSYVTNIIIMTCDSF